MKTPRFLLSVLALALCALPLRADEAADKTHLVNVEEEMTAAIVRGDAEGFGKLLAPDWKMVGSEGELLSRDQVLRALKSGKLKFTEYKNSNVEVRVFGNTAVVIGTGNSKGEWDGTSFTSNNRFTDVYVRTDGTWRCVSTHTSEIARN